MTSFAQPIFLLLVLIIATVSGGLWKYDSDMLLQFDFAYLNDVDNVSIPMDTILEKSGPEATQLRVVFADTTVPEYSAANDANSPATVERSSVDTYCMTGLRLFRGANIRMQSPSRYWGTGITSGFKGFTMNVWSTGVYQTAAVFETWGFGGLRWADNRVKLWTTKDQLGDGSIVYGENLDPLHGPDDAYNVAESSEPWLYTLVWDYNTTLSQASVKFYLNGEKKFDGTYAFVRRLDSSTNGFYTYFGRSNSYPTVNSYQGVIYGAQIVEDVKTDDEVHQTYNRVAKQAEAPIASVANIDACLAECKNGGISGKQSCSHFQYNAAATECRITKVATC